MGALARCLGLCALTHAHSGSQQPGAGVVKGLWQRHMQFRVLYRELGEAHGACTRHASSADSFGTHISHTEIIHHVDRHSCIHLLIHL